MSSNESSQDSVYSSTSSFEQQDSKMFNEVSIMQPEGTNINNSFFQQINSQIGTERMNYSQQYPVGHVNTGELTQSKGF